MNLQTLGFTEFFKEAFQPYKEHGLIPGRISLEHKRIYRVITEQGELLGEITGKMRYQAHGREDYPAVGDWVAIQARPEEQKATIHAVLPRFSKFSRKAAGTATEEQIVAANVNTIFLVNALNQDFNVRRIERYLLMAWESGSNPVVILSKADLCEDVEEKINEVESVALGVPIHAVSVEQNTGLEALQNYMGEGQTVALLGSSGVGKSTLVNYLYGDDVLKTSGIREEDSKGRHTTTHRELIVLESGSMVIDTPGMRELQLWEGDESLSQSFQDVEELAESCRFRDCTHHNEPGCEVRQAIEEGTLEQGRYDSYVKLQREMAYFARKEDQKLALAEKAKWKKISGDRTRVNRK